MNFITSLYVRLLFGPTGMEAGCRFFGCDGEIFDWWVDLEVYCLFCFRILISFLSCSISLVSFMWLSIVFELLRVDAFPHIFLDVIGLRSWILFSSYIICFVKWSFLGLFLVFLLVSLSVNNLLVTSVLLAFLFLLSAAAFA